ncbi:MAG: transcription elongation factor GreA [Dehalococcoidia bacterium]|nr:transcription elongation factor GreA [Dehalococcoidia bacterium]
MVQRKVHYLTAGGQTRLREELDVLRMERRRDIAEKLKLAAEVGGTVDNAEYDDAKREQSRVEGRIQDLEEMLQDVQLIPNRVKASGGVQVGSHVTVKGPRGSPTEYTIVGSAEAEPARGRISNTSPVGTALIGKKPGADVTVQTPNGPMKLKIVSIK